MRVALVILFFACPLLFTWTWWSEYYVMVFEVGLVSLLFALPLIALYLGAIAVLGRLLGRR